MVAHSSDEVNPVQPGLTKRRFDAAVPVQDLGDVDCLTIRNRKIEPIFLDIQRFLEIKRSVEQLFPFPLSHDYRLLSAKLC